MQQPSAGKVNHFINNKAIDAGDLYQFVAFAAPGQDIVDEMTLVEFLAFHFSFKRMLPNFSVDKVIEEMGLEKAKHKQIGDFSSGMKQRVKLAQAIFADTPLLCLDEPCTNLDNAGVEQYRRWMEQYTIGRLVIVASNDPREYFFCRDTLQMGDYK
jgi:ABC-type multidrug transport system ATPase subunit